jgi:hypothetical protein
MSTVKGGRRNFIKSNYGSTTQHYILLHTYERFQREHCEESTQDSAHHDGLCKGDQVQLTWQCKLNTAYDVTSPVCMTNPLYKTQLINHSKT